jgi:phospholipase C
MLSPKPVHHDKPARHNMRRVLYASAASLALCCSSPGRAHDGDRDNDRADTQTPIKHVVIIIPENRTFDNYFGTYPHAANIPDEQSWLGVPAPKFVAKRNTPAVNGLTPALLQNNPNRSLIGGPANPTRLRPADAYTCDMAHNYEPEQQAYDGGKVDRFPQTASGSGQGCAVDGSTVMNYYDGNTVQALWNYAQHFAISDNHSRPTMARLYPATPISFWATRTASSSTIRPTPPTPTSPASTSIRRTAR